MPMFSPDGTARRLQRRPRPDAGGRSAHPRRDGLRQAIEDVLEPTHRLSRTTRTTPAGPSSRPTASRSSSRSATRPTSRASRARPTSGAPVQLAALHRRRRERGRRTGSTAANGLTPTGNDYLPSPEPRLAPRLLSDGEPRLGGRLLLGVSSPAAATTATPGTPKGPGRRSASKSIWVSAIDIDANAGHRPEPPGLLPAGPGARRAATSAPSRCSRPARATA